MIDMQANNIYRRRIRVQTGPAEARADLEDDPHRYGVVIRHDSNRVLSAEGLALRTPWNLCRDAASMLSALEGMPLVADYEQALQLADTRLQCTHMFDIAGLAITHAARGIHLREYDFDVIWSDTRLATMRIDGIKVLEWSVEAGGTRVLAPEPVAGQDLRTMKPWIQANCTSPEQREAAYLFRRAIHISGSRRLDLDALPNAAATGHSMGACYIFRPGIAEHAIRMPGTKLNFTNCPERLLSDLDPKT